MCGSSDNEQPQISYSKSPDYDYQKQLFSSIQEPYMQSQYKLYQDVFEPQMRSLGGILGEDLKNPMTLPEDVWANIWNKSREKTVGEYGKLKQGATERAAGSGMLGQGPTEKYMQQLDLSQAKSIEDLAVDTALAEWQERKSARQTAISNMSQFLNATPQFNLNLPGYDVTTGLSGGSDSGKFSMLGTGLGALAGGLLAAPTGGMSIPIGAAIGAGVGGGVGSLF